MCFQWKCPDFLIKMSAILDPRIPPFRRSVTYRHTVTTDTPTDRHTDTLFSGEFDILVCLLCEHTM